MDKRLTFRQFLLSLLGKEKKLQKHSKTLGREKINPNGREFIRND